MASTTLGCEVLKLGMHSIISFKLGYSPNAELKRKLTQNLRLFFLKRRKQVKKVEKKDALVTWA
jgi:hypothetical protein